VPIAAALRWKNIALAVSHLTGALGKPVWVLLGNNARWLWLLDRTDYPWAKAEGDWNIVFDAVSAEPMSLVGL
jgi:hypothetical protein